MTEQPGLRIIHCFRSPVGGVFRHVRDLIEEHVAAGHQVGILCDSTTGGEHEEKLFAQIEPLLSLGLIRLPMKRSISPGDLLALWKSYKHIKSLQPDILHGHSAKGGVLSRVIGSLLRVNRYSVARLYSPHGGSLHYSRASLSGRVVLATERMLERFTDAICFVCDYERTVYRQKVGEPRTRTLTVLNGVREEEFIPVPPGPAATDFLYIGMLRDLKGPDVFIDAIASATRRTGKVITASVVGDGPDREKYSRQIADAGLSDRITMYPSMSARQAFALARTVVVPSRAEALPYIVLEALAAGKTVIASRVGGIPELLGTGSEAMATPGDPEDLARILLTALDEPERLKAAMPPVDILKAEFSARTMSRKILELYHSILPRRGT